MDVFHKKLYIPPLDVLYVFIKRIVDRLTAEIDREEMVFINLYRENI